MNLVELRRNIKDWRHRATVLCCSNPVLWTAMYGVPLVDYLRELDRVDRVLDELGVP